MDVAKWEKAAESKNINYGGMRNGRDMAEKCFERQSETGI